MLFDHPEAIYQSRRRVLKSGPAKTRTSAERGCPPFGKGASGEAEKFSVYCMGMFSLCDFVKSCSVKLNSNSSKRDNDGVISLVINS